MDILYVRWADSVAEIGWKDTDDLVDGPEVCESIGWLVREADGFLTLAGSLATQTELCQGAMTIPLSAIVEVRPVRLGKKIKLEER